MKQGIGGSTTCRASGLPLTREIAMVLPPNQHGEVVVRIGGQQIAVFSDAENSGGRVATARAHLFLAAWTFAREAP